jgi:hypothetical protein
MEPGQYLSQPLIDGETVFVSGSGPANRNTGKNGERIIEGYGVDLGIEVDNDPKSEIEGRDPQLERGISEVSDSCAPYVGLLLLNSPVAGRPLLIKRLR